MDGSSRVGVPALVWWLPLVSLVVLTGCVTSQSYIDPALPVVRAEDFKPTLQAGPVQVLFEFRTRGTPNAAATTGAKPMVLDAIGKTGLFTQVSETPVPDGRTLTIVIDNVRLNDPESPAGSGFVTGFTFGLVGTNVSDGYVCTATYQAPGGKSSSTTVRHALHTALGNASGPPGVPPMAVSDAIPQIMQQLTLNALKALRQGGL